MNLVKPTFSTIVKLVIWSIIVGAILYWLRISTGDIYGWVAHHIASVWHWMANTGIKYMLLGATIVVPVYFIMHLRKK